MIDPDTDMAAVDALILADDKPGRGWKRRAVGASRDKALAEIPRVGQLLCQIPIEPLREIQRLIKRANINQAQWVREAIVQRYLRDGGSPDVAEQALAMRRDFRRWDVPRDQYGQDRNREGRKRPAR